MPGFFRLASLMLALLLAAAGAVAAATAAPEPATLYILNREIITMRGMVFGATPAQRVERARERLRNLPPSALDLPLKAVPAEVGETRGVQFFLGDRPLFSVLHDDVDALVPADAPKK